MSEITKHEVLPTEIMFNIDEIKQLYLFSSALLEIQNISINERLPARFYWYADRRYLYPLVSAESEFHLKPFKENLERLITKRLDISQNQFTTDSIGLTPILAARLYMLMQHEQIYKDAGIKSPKELANLSDDLAGKLYFIGKEIIDKSPSSADIALPPKTKISYDEIKMHTAWEQYRSALQRVENGVFPVRKGTKVFRVINGASVGRSSAGLNVGERCVANYATPHPECVFIITRENDTSQGYYDGSDYDRYQSVAVIKVDEFFIPTPDRTHGIHADRDQIVVTGEVEEILDLGDFYTKYGDELTPDFDKAT